MCNHAYQHQGRGVGTYLLGTRYLGEHSSQAERSGTHACHGTRTLACLASLTVTDSQLEVTCTRTHVCNCNCDCNSVSIFTSALLHASLEASNTPKFIGFRLCSSPPGTTAFRHLIQPRYPDSYIAFLLPHSWAFGHIHTVSSTSTPRHIRDVARRHGSLLSGHSSIPKHPPTPISFLAPHPPQPISTSSLSVMLLPSASP